MKKVLAIILALTMLLGAAALAEGAQPTTAEMSAHRNDGLTGGADVHRHGDDHLLGRCAQRRYLLVACQLLPVMGVHAAVKALLHRSTSQI